MFGILTTCQEFASAAILFLTSACKLPVHLVLPILSSPVVFSILGVKWVYICLVVLTVVFGFSLLVLFSTRDQTRASHLSPNMVRLFMYLLPIYLWRNVFSNSFLFSQFIYCVCEVSAHVWSENSFQKLPLLPHRLWGSLPSGSCGHHVFSHCPHSDSLLVT